jgi:hypothetical protein
VVASSATSLAAQSVDADLLSRVIATADRGQLVAEGDITALRALGPAGLEAVLSVSEGKLAGAAGVNASWERLIDRVAAQKDARYSRLFWHTDLELAKAAAAVSGKPILSLHLLGDLREDYSCANSRLFRAILYPDASVGAALRDDFILHWWSSLQVPRITVEYGDGRRLQATVTGNSIHYVLDAQGRPLDAIPGLMSPRRFLEQLQWARQLHQGLREATPFQRATAVSMAHGFRIAEIDSRHQGLAGTRLPAAPAVAEATRALAAERLTMSKSAMPTETAAIEELGMPAPEPNSPADRRRLALLTAQEAAGLIITSPVVDRHLASSTAAESITMSLVASVAGDTAISYYDLLPRTSAWFADNSAGDDLQALNRRISTEVFLTPHDDPWMGIDPGLAYLALPDNGLVEALSP